MHSFFARRSGGIASISVAIHASINDGRQWSAYRALLPQSVQLLTPDLLGYPRGGEWRAPSRVSLKDEARSLLPLLRAQPRPVDLVGHSYGAAVALQVALLWPELVRSLTLYEPVLFNMLMADPDSHRQAMEITCIRQCVCELVTQGRFSEAAELYVSYWGGDSAWTGLPEARRASVVAKMPKVQAEFGALFDSRLDAASLAEAGIAVRLVHGLISPASAMRIAELLARQLPHAEVVALPEASHIAPITRPRSLVNLLFSPPTAVPMAMAA